MKIVRVLWKFIVGAAVTAGGWFLVAPELGQTTLTGAAVIGIALLAVGVSILAGIWD